MIKTYEFPSTFSKLREVEELSICQECFWYPFPFLFRENVYSIAYDRRSNAGNTRSTSGTCNIIVAKRLIQRIRHQDYSDIIHLGFGLNNHNSINTNLYFRVLLETTCFVLEIPASYRVIDEINKRCQFSRSIHSIFPFLEDNLPKSNYLLNIILSRNNHFENLIRLSRRRIQDASFLHLLRLVSYIYKASRVKTYMREREEQKSINASLWNFYLHEIDFLLLVSWKQLCGSHPKNFVSTDQTNINRKERCVCVYEYQLEKSPVIFQSHLIRKICAHYGRYKNQCFVIFRGTRYFARKWIYYLCVFTKSNFHYRTKFSHMAINSKLLSGSCVSLLGYILTVQPVSNKIQVQTAKESYTSILNGKKLYPRAPILLLIKLMAKHHFCDIIGRPLTKLAWVTPTDDDPLDKFAKIWGILYLYHSGSINRDGLRRSRYILQVSLNNTLASKHKITTRLSRREFDSELPKTSFSCGYFNNQRVWNLDLIRPILITSNIVTPTRQVYS
uniref:Maturase K n=1 Tax=Odontosoria chinensis TaxID=32133 RepID=A0A343WSB8_9MONI|nr:maturase K [Odontosoria chinensis]